MSFSFTGRPDRRALYASSTRFILKKSAPKHPLKQIHAATAAVGAAYNRQRNTTPRDKFRGPSHAELAALLETHKHAHTHPRHALCNDR